GCHCYLLSFPTRRSSDLALAAEGRVEYIGACDVDAATAEGITSEHGGAAFTDWRELLKQTDVVSIATPTETHCEIACAFLDAGRSEEHTSELQSRENLVC